MGIYDRDYMRRRESDTPESARTVARRGLVIAVVVVVVVLLLGNAIRRDAEARREMEKQRKEWERQVDFPSYPMPAEPAPEPPPMLKRLLNVNTATMEELEKVPYMRKRMAESIIENRPFKSMEDLDRAWGIGKPTIERLRFYLMVE